jgi:hypothetical protein
MTEACCLVLKDVLLRPRFLDNSEMLSSGACLWSVGVHLYVVVAVQKMLNIPDVGSMYSVRTTRCRRSVSLTT